MTEPEQLPESCNFYTVEEIGKDPSNTPVEELTAPLDEDDDVHDRIALVNSSTAEDLRGADQ